MNTEDEVILDKTAEVGEPEAENVPVDYESDVESFKQAYPHVSLEKLIAAPAFIGFGKYRFGVEPFADIYKEYSEFVKTIENAAQAKRARRNERSTGGGQSTPYTGLTREQSEQLEAWNKAYPQLKMTPKEFLSK